MYMRSLTLLLRICAFWSATTCHKRCRIIGSHVTFKIDSCKKRENAVERKHSHHSKQRIRIHFYTTIVLQAVQDTGPAQTDLSIRHEGVLEVAGIPAFAVGLKVSLYYPYVFPDFRITPLEGVYVPCEQLSSIEAETNALLPLEAPHDPLPAQFNYLCRMLHAMLAGQGAPQAASPISSSLRGNFVSRGRIGLSRADPVHQIDHAIHV